MMVNNNTYTNKTNNHLSPKIIEHEKDDDTPVYNVGNPDSSLGPSHKYGGVKPINGISNLLIIVCFIFILPAIIYIYIYYVWCGLRTISLAKSVT